ncbi:MAG: rhodanese-like domain-containing protein [Actinomycetota bacterium]|nr:rhodanese-like domain-containing protein [Actinomycetota bacterium]
MTSAVRSVTAAELAGQLGDGEELALLDAREQGVYFRSHLFRACCVPLSSLELLLDDLVPRRTTRIVWCDDGSVDHEGIGLAERAAARSAALGWSACSVLDGGTEAWAAGGGELYAGINVPSKAFGEFIENTFSTPRISATDLKALVDAGSDIVVLDSRPPDEFVRMSIPGGIDCPGAELVHRVKDVVPGPDTLVVVNCAGRTRSIIGAQSLINAGLANQVVALENGTMGWQLAGFAPATGSEDHAADPTDRARTWAEEAANVVGQRFGVRSVPWETVDRWRSDLSRTTYLLDVRTTQEFATGHLPGSRNAPGGQLVQATGEYVATMHSRLVLIDDTAVRATMTASWLRQLGWHDAVVLAGGVAQAGVPLLAGSAPRADAARTNAEPVTSVGAPELEARLANDPNSVTVLDLGDSLEYRRRGHVPGAWWGVRSRLPQARSAIGPVEQLVLTSSDGELAKLAVSDVRHEWPTARIMVLAGGTKAWRHGGRPTETGLTRPTTEPDDVWDKPYDHDDGEAERHMRDYLTWEIALVEQLDRDPLVHFPSYPAREVAP